MFSRTRVMFIASAMVSALTLSGCGSDVEPGAVLTALSCSGTDVPNASNTACEAAPPPICNLPLVLDVNLNECVLPPDPNAPDPSIYAGVDEAILFYNRPQDADNSANDLAYEGWKLHTWSNEQCDAYADADTDWASGRVHDGVDPNYGAYWILALKPGYADTEDACANFIIHKGTDGSAGTDDGKEMQGGDFMMPLDQAGAFARMNWTFSGVAEVFESPLASLGVSIGDANAHWLDTHTLVWNIDTALVDTSSVKLFYSASAGLEIDGTDIINGQSLPLEETTLTEEQIALYPEVAEFMAFSGDWTAEQAKSVLKNQLVVAAFDSAEELTSANQVQIAKVIDDLYTSGEEDANEATLGVVYQEANINVNLWAPTAQSVSLKVYDTNKTETASHAMNLDTATGIWSYIGNTQLDRMFYRFEVTVYHPVSGNIEVLEVTDPYSLSLSMNGIYSQFVNLEDDDLKPEGWDAHTIPTIAEFEDAVLYEGHIRDFSALDQSTSAANRGKYMAFTEEDSLPYLHLKSLADNGVTHFHMLPANDIATIDEDETQTVELYSTVADLCALNENASVCDVEDDSATLLSVFQSYDSASEPQAAQTLANDMRAYDRFNWGYDPHHFTTPEGSYASDPDGVARIKEMRAMIQALHEMGLRVVLDVVYNHTNASGLNDKSVLDKVVPGYYHRYDVASGAIIRETCCDDTEPRNAMMEKLMQDSLIQWTSQYKFDSFRFDIMSQASTATMQRLFAAIQAIDDDMYFYGEGWTRIDRQYEQANQPNMAGTEIGTFNDRIREAVRQGHIFDDNQNDTALATQDSVKMSLAGTLADYVLEDFNGVASTTSVLGGYALDPADIINYVSKHDNETLWDQLNYVLPQDLSLTQRVRAQNIAATIPLMSQGIPFLQLGGEMLRSKSMDRNTYDSGDWFSWVDFTKESNNWNVGLPLAEDNQSRWAEMSGFIYSPERAASMTEIEFASAVFNEMLSIRSSSPLFRLTTSADIIDRVGFHNIGRNQTQGLIVMSIDDGLSSDPETPRIDLDPMLDALVVVINSSYEEQSHSVASATGFSLHDTLLSSIDATLASATFTEGEDDQGTFTVPPLTTAVFVKTQDGDQGEGLSAYATSGAPDVVPYGSDAVLVRGSFNDWGETDAMSYTGNGVYQAIITIAAGEYEFKLASADWSTIDFGASEPAVTLGEDKTLAVSGANLTLSLAEQTTLKFSLDASDSAAPILTVDYEEPFYPTTVYVRGSMNDWSEDNPMDYAVGGQYTVTMDITAGDYEFKIASADWSTVDYGSAGADNTASLDSAIDAGIGGSNISINIPVDGSYTFLFNAADLAAPTIGVFNAQMFGDTTVFIRGSMNGWGESDAITYIDNSTYEAELSIDAGDYEFKIASADWSTVDFGALGDDQMVTLATQKELGRSGANLMLSIENSGTYKFTVTGPDPSAPKVTVTEVIP